MEVNVLKYKNTIHQISTDKFLPIHGIDHPKIQQTVPPISKDKLLPIDGIDRPKNREISPLCFTD